MVRGPYRLHVSYLSNEHPFATDYDPWPQNFETDEDAIKWATYMRKNLIGYDVTLLKDGVVISIKDQ